MESNIVCNFRKCRKRLSKWAWVTSCSHIFCDEDGKREFKEMNSCPACGTSLFSELDIMRIDLQPSEQTKSMHLAGHKPENILEMAFRAMAFWTYQIHQEVTYQEYVATKARNRNTQLKEFYELVLTRSQAENSALKGQLTMVRNEMEEIKKRYAEISEKTVERSRQYTRLQAMYEDLRRWTLNRGALNGEGDAHDTKPRLRTHSAAFGKGFSCAKKTLWRLPASHGPDQAHDVSIDERDFVLRPMSTPLSAIPVSQAPSSACMCHD